MIDQAKICAAFCDEISIAKVPAGLAVRTPFTMADGDQVGFYIVEGKGGRWRFEDSGVIVPMLEAEGVTVRSGQREESFKQLLTEYQADFVEDSQEIVSHWLKEDDIAGASLKFAALLLRLQDLQFLAPDTVENTFRQDAQAAIRKRFGAASKIETDAQISDELANYVVDALIKGDNRPPVAVYFATSEPRVDEAVILAMEAKMKGLTIPVLLLLENVRPKGVTDRALARAHNLLDSLPVFRKFESNAMDRIATYVQGSRLVQ